MNAIVRLAVIILIGSIVALAWGYNYTLSHQLSGLANMFGNVDATYTLASWSMGIGAIGFLLGIALLIAGLVRRKA